MTGQCKFDENLFCFFLSTHKRERNSTHIAHIAKAPQANAETEALSKSALLPTLLNYGLISKVIFHSIIGKNLVTL